MSLYHYVPSSLNAYHIVGFLHIYRNDDKGVTVSRKTRKQCSYCFLFSKHFIIAQRIEKKGEEVYRIQKDAGILPLAKCRIRENSQPIITDSSGTSIYLSIYLSIYSFIHPSTIHLSIQLSVLPFTCSSIHPPVHSYHLSIHSYHLSIHPFACLHSPPIHSSIHLFLHPPTCPFISPVHPSIHLSIHQSIHPSVHLNLFTYLSAIHLFIII